VDTASKEPSNTVRLGKPESVQSDVRYSPSTPSSSLASDLSSSKAPITDGIGGSVSLKPKKLTLLDIRAKYERQEPISMVTAYDFSSAVNVDRAGIDIGLVGDSLGMVMLGYSNTTSVTMEEMIHHCKAVSRGIKRAFLVGDMPFGSYEVSDTEAVKNAIRLMKEGNVEAVKMEGGIRIKDAVKAVVLAGIPVIGHIGLTPQTASALGGFRVQGKTAESARNLLNDAIELEKCGVSALVIESVPEPVASYITKHLRIPTIGIGAGAGTSGQVLVYHDMLGLYSEFVPKFCKTYRNLSVEIQNALKQYRKEVESRVFPSQEFTYPMKKEEFEKAFPSFSNKETSIQDKSAKERMEIQEETAQSKAKTFENRAELSSFIPKSSEKRKTIAVIGGGAMGSLIGGRLASTELYNVWLVSSWKEHVEKINQKGLTIRNLDRSCKQVENLRATTEISQMLDQCGPADLAIVMVKGPQTLRAAEIASKLLKERTGLVLTLQNGLGNREMISQVLGSPERVFQGVTNLASYIVDSGRMMMMMMMIR